MSLDLDKQIAYWREGALDDWESAVLLLEKGKVRQGLFLAHLSLEKALKALVTRTTCDVPPKIHDLPRLAALSGLVVPEDHATTLKIANAFNLAGRYPDRWPALPSQAGTSSLTDGMGKALEWLLKA